MPGVKASKKGIAGAAAAPADKQPAAQTPAAGPRGKQDKVPVTRGNVAARRSSPREARGTKQPLAQISTAAAGAAAAAAASHQTTPAPTTT